MAPPHEHRVRVRYAETDQMGPVHHANYLLYVEDGRTRMMAERGCAYADLERQGWGLVVRRADLRYRAGAGYDEELVVRTTVKRVRAASIELSYAIARVSDGTLLVTGSTELCCVDLRRTPPTPTPLPPHVRAAMEP